VEGLQVNELFFQRTEERLHDRVVETIPLATHALMWDCQKNGHSYIWNEFEFMPELKWRFAYFAIWGIVVLIAVLMLIFF
jgi:hypothetical protein